MTTIHPSITMAEEKTKLILQTAQNDMIDCEPYLLDEIHGVGIKHKSSDYTFATIYWNPKTGFYDVWQAIPDVYKGSDIDDEKRYSMNNKTHFSAINQARKLQHEIYGNAFHYVTEYSEGVMLRPNYN